MPASAATSAVPFWAAVPTGLTTTVRRKRGWASRFVSPDPSPAITFAGFDSVSAFG